MSVLFDKKNSIYLASISVLFSWEGGNSRDFVINTLVVGNVSLSQRNGNRPHQTEITDTGVFATMVTVVSNLFFTGQTKLTKRGEEKQNGPIRTWTLSRSHR